MPEKEVRLIDANAMREDWLENGENEFVYDTNAVLDSIDAQPTIDPESLRSQWRNAETAPPQEPGEYIVMIKGGANATTLLYDGGLWFEEDEEGWQTYYDVTHWLPLPEPPAKES